MSTIEPTEPYVYQPEPVNSPLSPRLWSVAGPGAEGFSGIRLTKEHANKLAGLLKFRRDALDEMNARQMDDVVNANISTIRDIHERSLRLISRIVSESLSAHPHYDESYPKILALAEKNKDIEEPKP